MTQNTHPTSPMSGYWSPVLSELRRHRALIDQAIVAMETLSGGSDGMPIIGGGTPNLGGTRISASAVTVPKRPGPSTRRMASKGREESGPRIDTALAPTGDDAVVLRALKALGGTASRAHLLTHTSLSAAQVDVVRHRLVSAKSIVVTGRARGG